MTGWAVSRHPEWDLMYAAGMTVREISDTVARAESTVRRHFHVREQYNPGTHAAHEAALIARGPSRATTIWRRRLTDVRSFIDTHDRLPTGHGDHAEQLLHAWLNHQRAELRAGACRHPS